MSEHFAKELAIVLFFLQQVQDLPENDLNHLCLKSLQMDYFSLPSIYQQLLQKNLALSYDSQDEKEKDSDFMPLKRWKITSYGKKLFQNLPLHLLEGSHLFLQKLMDDYKKELKQHYVFEASVKENNLGSYHLKLKQFEKKVCTFSVQLTFQEKMEADKIAALWCSGELSENLNLVFKIKTALEELPLNRNRYNKELESFNHDP